MSPHCGVSEQHTHKVDSYSAVVVFDDGFLLPLLSIFESLQNFVFVERADYRVAETV